MKGHTYGRTRRGPEETVAEVRQRLQASVSTSSRRPCASTPSASTSRLHQHLRQESIRTIGTRKQMEREHRGSGEASALMELVERFSFFSYMKQTPSGLHLWRRACETLPRAPGLAIHDTVTTGRAIRSCEVPWRWPGVELSRSRGADPIDWFYLINEYNGPPPETLWRRPSSTDLRGGGAPRLLGYQPRRAHHPSIDPLSVRDEAARMLMDKYAAHGIRLFIKDFSWTRNSTIAASPGPEHLPGAE